MKNNFDTITDKNLKSIYDELWKGKDFHGKVIKTWWRHGEKSKDSDNSFQFDVPNVDYKNIKKSDVHAIRTELKRIFQPACNDFDEKFNDVCSGSGNEYQKIMRLHSSSLCSLLFFCDISDNNPLDLTLDSERYFFTKVLFEYKNKVINEPSNMDVVLIGQNYMTNKKAFFFLESKFSEYVNKNSCKFTRLGTGYLEEPYSDTYYNDTFLDYIDLRIIKKDDGTPDVFEDTNNNRKYYGLETLNGDKTYVEGLKQIISHYIGVSNFLKKDFCDDRCRGEFQEMDLDNSHILLGGIMFDFEFAKDKLDRYNEYYTKLSKKLSSINSKIHVVRNIINYSELLEHKTYQISDRIKHFYSRSKLWQQH